MWQKSSYFEDLSFSATEQDRVGPSLQSRNALFTSAACCTHYNSVQMFEPFQDQNPHFVGMIRLNRFVMQDFQKQIGSVVLWPNFVEAKFGFLWKFFFLWNLGFGTNMESAADVTLNFEDLAVNKYLYFFLIMCAFVCEKSHFFLFCTFYQWDCFFFIFWRLTVTVCKKGHSFTLFHTLLH